MTGEQLVLGFLVAAICIVLLFGVSSIKDRGVCMTYGEIRYKTPIPVMSGNMVAYIYIDSSQKVCTEWQFPEGK